MRSRRKTVRVCKREATCLLVGHSWEPTISPGLLCCPRCGITAHCPVCIPGIPNPEVRMAYCQKHRALRDAQQKKVQA